MEHAVQNVLITMMVVRKVMEYARGATSPALYFFPCGRLTPEIAEAALA